MRAPPEETLQTLPSDNCILSPTMTPPPLAAGPTLYTGLKTMKRSLRESFELQQVYICAPRPPVIMIFLATRGNTSDDEPGG